MVMNFLFFFAAFLSVEAGKAFISSGLAVMWIR